MILIIIGYYKFTMWHFMHLRSQDIIDIRSSVCAILTLPTVYHQYTVKPVVRGHLWDKEKVVSYVRWPLKTGSIHLKFAMVLLNRGDCKGRFGYT